MKRVVIYILLFLFHGFILSQDNLQNKNVEELKEMGKDSLIKLALSYMDNSIDASQYNIRVLSNETEVIVSFRIPIKYIPYNSEYFYDASVDLSNDFISYANYSNPEDYQSNTVAFYTPRREHKKNIEFIVNAINKSENKNIVPVNLSDLKDDLIIREKPDHYNVEYVSDNFDQAYKINKVSGKIYDLIMSNLESDPNGNDVIEYEEVED